MKIVINTQYRENYAAHNEDYDHGVDTPHWKFKGGSTYVVPNFNDYSNITEVMKNLDSLITYGNPASEEYILDWEIVEDSAKVCDSWETVTQIFINEDNVTALKVTDNREDGWMRSEILEKTEAWTMCSDSERSDYSASFLMHDGDICDTQDELNEWFEAA
jgi:hypothetical protein